MSIVATVATSATAALLFVISTLKTVSFGQNNKTMTWTQYGLSVFWKFALQVFLRQNAGLDNAGADSGDSGLAYYKHLVTD